MLKLHALLQFFTSKNFTRFLTKFKPKYSCRISIIPNFRAGFVLMNVYDKDKAVQFDLRELQIHIKCNNLNYLDYRYLQNCDEYWYCIECCNKMFPFNSLSSNKNILPCYISIDSNITQWKDLENDHNNSLPLKPSLN